MSTTILDTLRNADYNLQKNGHIGLIIAKTQLHNAATLLEKGYNLHDNIAPLLEPYEAVDNVPDAKED